MQITNHSSSIQRSHLKANYSDNSAENDGVSASDIQRSNITQLNSRIQAIEERSNQYDEATLKNLKDQRDAAISRLKGNSDVSGYAPELAAIAEPNGVTYTTAIENRNWTTVALISPRAESQALLTHTTRVPWKGPVVNARVSELMSTED